MAKTILATLIVLLSHNLFAQSSAPSLDFLEEIQLEDLLLEVRKNRNSIVRYANQESRNIPWSFINENCENRAHAVSWYFSSPLEFASQFSTGHVNDHYEAIRNNPRIRIGELYIAGPLRTTQSFVEEDASGPTLYWPYHVANVAKTELGLYVIDLSHKDLAIPIKEWIAGLTEFPEQCHIENYDTYRESFMFWQAGLYGLQIGEPERFCSVYIGPAFFGGDSLGLAQKSVVAQSVLSLFNHSASFDTFAEENQIENPKGLVSTYKAQSYEPVCEDTNYYICRYRPFRNED